MYILVVLFVHLRVIHTYVHTCSTILYSGLKVYIGTSGFILTGTFTVTGTPWSQTAWI